MDSTGLYYYGARYYDPQIGRFISPDTIVPHLGNPQSLNRYSYCRNNPLKYIDPSGHYEGFDETTGEYTGLICDWGPRPAVGGNSGGEGGSTLPVVSNGSLASGVGLGVVVTSGLEGVSGLAATSGAATAAGAGAAAGIVVGSVIVSYEYNQSVAESTKYDDTEKLILMGMDPMAVAYYAKHKDSQTAGEIISKEKLGKINREFPGEWRDKTLKEIIDAAKRGDDAAKTAKKLLTDNRFNKPR